MTQPSTSPPILSDADAWSALTDPLSVRDRLRLSWLRSKMDAVELLDELKQPIDFAFARRLAFIRWLVTTGRITDEVRATLESLKTGRI